MFSHLDEVEMTRRYRREHDLMGLEPEDLLGMDIGFTEEELAPLFYPSDNDLVGGGVRGIYLNNYIRWDTKTQHESMLKQYNYFSGPQLRTFDTYNDVDCAIYSSVHDSIKMKKLGFGKVTDHVCREIRHRRLTREQGIKLIQEYANKPDGDLENILKWLGISENKFWQYVDGQRDEASWKLVDNNWVLRDSVSQHINSDGIDAARL